MPRKATKPVVDVAPAEKPRLPALDPIQAELEAGRNAIEGNRKLSLAVDALREALQVIVIAEMDNATGLPVSALQLRQLAGAGLDRYSQLTGQSWRRNPIINSWAGDKSAVAD